MSYIIGNVHTGFDDLEKGIAVPRFVREPCGKICRTVEGLFSRPRFIVALILAVLFLAFLLRLDLLQALVIQFGSAAKGSQLNSGVWHGRFERWGLALVANPAFILLLLYAARTFFCPESKRKTFDIVFLCLAYAVWLAFTGYTALRHESWMDELFVYVKARDLSVGGLLADVKVDGNFALWSILLSPLVKAGCPAELLTCVSFGLCAVLLLLFLLRSPFSVYEKAAFIFTAAASYHYPVVARPYILFALLTFLLAVCWEKRTDHPFLVGAMIALMANTHLYAEGFVGILSLYILVADILLPWKTLSKSVRIKRLSGLVVAFAGVLIAAILVVPACWTVKGIVLGQAGRMNLNMKAFFSNWIWEDLTVSAAPVMVILLIVAVRLLFVHRGMFVIFSAAFAYMLLFHIFIYSASVPNRGSMWLFILIFAFWNARDKGKSPLLLLLLIFAINPSWNFRDWTMEYSGEKKLGEYIERNMPREEPVQIVGTDLVSAYVPDYDVNVFAPISVSAEELDGKIDRFFAESGSDSFDLIISKVRVGTFTYPLSHRYEKLYESSEIMAQIYQFAVIRVYR